MMFGMVVGWYIGAVTTRFSMPIELAEQFTANLTAYLTCLPVSVPQCFVR
jgi:hypothetical protein